MSSPPTLRKAHGCYTFVCIDRGRINLAFYFSFPNPNLDEKHVYSVELVRCRYLRTVAAAKHEYSLQTSGYMAAAAVLRWVALHAPAPCLPFMRMWRHGNVGLKGRGPSTYVASAAVSFSSRI